MSERGEIYVSTDVEADGPIPGPHSMLSFASAVYSADKPVFVAYPAGFDFTFVYWYLHRFAGESPFSHSALDMKTLAMALLRLPYREATKRNMPRRWFEALPHTHVALDDAVEQGALFCNMLQELGGTRSAGKRV
jgi:DNA polymerase III alpha subunit (gram-positive type)